MGQIIYMGNLMTI